MSESRSYGVGVEEHSFFDGYRGNPENRGVQCMDEGPGLSEPVLESCMLPDQKIQECREVLWSSYKDHIRRIVDQDASQEETQE